MSAKTHTLGPADVALFKAELETILASRLFTRAPSLSKMLSYICSKHLEGNPELINEWTIAVEGLGRKADFDPEKDSIVRVEFHHLRKRLAAYYTGEGAGHSVRIAFPESGYVPQFIEEANRQSRSEVLKKNKTATKQPFYLAAALLLILLVVGSFAITHGTTRTSANTPVPAATPQDSIRLLAGFNSPIYIDSSGHSWTSDKYFTGGTPFSRPANRVYRTSDRTIYDQGREGDFRYDIPVKPGIYELRLHFAETRYGQSPLQGAEAQRRFNVSLNGRTILDDFDITNDGAGTDTAVVKVWNDVSPAPDGFMHFAFSGHSGPPMVNGLEILPAKVGQAPPVRLVCGMRPLYDKQGRFWSADDYYLGGRLVERLKPIDGPEDPSLFASVRFGNFSYAIPVLSGRTYQATMWFADSTFDRRRGRLFDILCNGRTLATDFDIVKEAGGQSRSVARTFKGLKPNAQGKLNLSFIPSRDYAGLSAIEILTEPRP